MAKDLTVKQPQYHGQRYGQFISNAIANYLEQEQRKADDYDIANALFYMSDDDLNNILALYDRVLEARKPLGFNGGRNG